jgi:hypothetical protein
MPPVYTMGIVKERMPPPPVTFMKTLRSKLLALGVPESVVEVVEKTADPAKVDRLLKEHTPKPLTQVDLVRCQAEIKECSFMTLHPRNYRRCPNPAVYIITEAEPGEDGHIRAMSLCEDCKKVADSRFPGKSIIVEKIDLPYLAHHG